MQTHDRTLLTVIAEAALERQLVADALRLGAHGYTVYEVRGGGAGSTVSGEWEADRAIELQLVCSAEVAQRIAEHVLGEYGRHWRLTVMLSDVKVFRAEKF